MPTLTEDRVYEHIAQYLNLKYPNLIYRFDLGGMWTPSHKARNLYGRLNRRAWPDFFLAVRATKYPTGTYSGLFLEIKREGSSPYLKDQVTLKKSEHVVEQAMMLKALESQGYRAQFAVGFDDAIEKIESYLGG